MASLQELLDLLEATPLWKRISKVPERMKILERRLEAVESRVIPAAAQSQICPVCGSSNFDRVAALPDPLFGGSTLPGDTWTCTICGHTQRFPG